jgi:hypothetical protein
MEGEDMFPATPNTPPPLHEHVAISEDQAKKAREILAELADGIEGGATLLTQGYDVIAYAGVLTDDNVTELAGKADSLWLVGSDRPAREVICFGSIVYLETEERHNLGLYSMHVKGGLVLVIGWPVEISLTQLRAEAQDAAVKLRRLLAEE